MVNYLKPTSNRLIFLLSAVCCLLATAVHAQDFSRWQFYADVTIHPQADDSFDSVYVDFTRLLKRDLQSKEALNEASIRVASLEAGKPGAAVPSRFIKDAGYNAVNNASGTLVFEVKGTREAGGQTYRVFFDTQTGNYGEQPQSETSAPSAANMVWNGDFEIVSSNYRGANRHVNGTGTLPHGWWGNLRNKKILEIPAGQAHSGKNILAFVAAEEGANTAITATPSAPALRVLPGQDYRFSFWVKGEGLSPASVIVAASVYWYDKDQKALPRVRVAGLPAKLSEFPWTQAEITLPSPPEAHYGGLRITTYSTTGHIAIDDIEARLAVPPLLKNAQFNR